MSPDALSSQTPDDATRVDTSLSASSAAPVSTPSTSVTDVPTRLPNTSIHTGPQHSDQQITAQREKLSQAATPSSAWKHVAGFFGTVILGAVSLPFAVIPTIGTCIGKFCDLWNKNHSKYADAGWKIGKCIMAGIPYVLFPAFEKSLNWLKTGSSTAAPKATELSPKEVAAGQLADELDADNAMMGTTGPKLLDPSLPITPVDQYQQPPPAP